MYLYIWCSVVRCGTRGAVFLLPSARTRHSFVEVLFLTQFGSILSRHCAPPVQGSFLMWVATLAILAMDAPHPPTLQPSSAVDAPSSFARNSSTPPRANSPTILHRCSRPRRRPPTTSRSSPSASRRTQPYSRLCELTPPTSAPTLRSTATACTCGRRRRSRASALNRGSRWRRSAPRCAPAPRGPFGRMRTPSSCSTTSLHAHLPHLLDASEEQRKHFILSRDISLLAHPFVNMGHALIDNSEFSHSFLETAWNVWPQPKPARWWGQAAVAFLLGGERAECRDDVQSAGC